MLTIDGSEGEGGGQVLRTALALSAVTGEAFRIEKMRAARDKPGLLRQHLTATLAAARLCNAHVDGAVIGSTALTFLPGRVQPGSFTFPVGSAGSATLVLQTVLWPLLAADAPSTVIVEGGTHNPAAPPVDFLQRTFVPLLRRMGAAVDVRMIGAGFFPAGGGKVEMTVTPGRRLSALQLTAVPGTPAVSARAMVANLPRTIAERELQTIAALLALPPSALRVDEVRSPGPGNYCCVDVALEGYSEVFSGFGQRGVRAETVAEGAVKEALAFLSAGVPVGSHLADQLLLPLALGSGGTFRTLAPTGHTRTNVDVIRRFLDVDIRTQAVDGDGWEITVAPQG